MNANGRCCRRFQNRHRHIARLGRPIYKSCIGLTVAQSIERERAVARRQMQMKKPKK